MRRIKDNVYIGSSSERTANNFSIGDYFIDEQTGEQFILAFTGDWIRLIADPLVVDELTVNTTLTADTFVGNGTGITNLDGDNLQDGSVPFSKMSSPVAVSSKDVRLYLPLTYAGENYVNTNDIRGVPPVSEENVVGVSEGRFGLGGASMSIAFTNEMLNPIFENVTTDYNFGSNDGSATRTLDTTKYTRNSAKIYSGTSAWIYFQKSSGISVAAGETLSVKALVFVPSEASVPSIMVRMSGVDYNATTTSIKDEWTEISTSWTNTTGSAQTVYPKIGVNSAVAGTYFWLADFQATKTGFQLPFRAYGMPGVSGSLGSVSVASKSKLAFPSPIAIPEPHTVLMWVKSSGMSPTAGHYKIFVRYGVYYTNNSYIVMRTNSSNLGIWFKSNSGDWHSHVVTNTDIGDVLLVGAVFDGSRIGLVINGTVHWAGAGASLLPAQNNVSHEFEFGGDYNNSQKSLNGWMSNVVILRGVDETLIKNIYDSGAPISVTHSTHELKTVGNSGYKTLINRSEAYIGNDSKYVRFTPVTKLNIAAKGLAREQTDISLYLPLTYAGKYQVNTNGKLGESTKSETGSVVGFSDGRFGNGELSLCESFENLITHPVGDNNGGYWYSSWGDTITDNNDVGLEEPVFKLESAGGSGCAAYHKITSFDANTDYTFSAKIFIPPGQDESDIRLRVLNDSWGEIASSARLSSDNGWQTASVTFNSGSTTSELRMMIWGWSLDTGEYLYFTEVQLTKTSYKLPFRYYGMTGVSGSNGTTSNATQPILKYDKKHLPNRYGWIHFNFRLEDTNYNSSITNWILCHPNTATNGRLYITRSTSGLYVRIVTSGFNISVSDTDWHQLDVVLDGSIFYVYLDGELLGSAGFTPNFDKVDWYLGTGFGGTTNTTANVRISNFVMSNSYVPYGYYIKAIYDSEMPVGLHSVGTQELATVYNTAKLTVNQNGINYAGMRGGHAFMLDSPATNPNWTSSVSHGAGTYTIPISDFTGLPDDLDFSSVVGWFVHVNGTGSVGMTFFTDTSSTTYYAGGIPATWGGTAQLALQGAVPNFNNSLYLKISSTSKINVVITGYIA